MSNVLYTNIGFFVVWFIKYIFIPLGVAVLVRVIVDKLLKPHPERQRKKRFNKNRLK
jgi:hypothetical protein